MPMQEKEHNYQGFVSINDLNYWEQNFYFRSKLSTVFVEQMIMIQKMLWVPNSHFHTTRNFKTAFHNADLLCYMKNMFSKIRRQTSLQSFPYLYVIRSFIQGSFRIHTSGLIHLARATVSFLNTEVCSVGNTH